MYRGYSGPLARTLFLVFWVLLATPDSAVQRTGFDHLTTGFE